MTWCKSVFTPLRAKTYSVAVRPCDAAVDQSGDLHIHYDSSLLGVQLGHTMKMPKAAAQLRLALAALLAVNMGVTPHARAETVYGFQRKSLPCNELCQAWLGLNESDRTDSIGESTKPAQPRGRLRGGLATSAAKGKAPHAWPEPGKTVALPPTVPYLFDSGSEPPAPLEHPRPAATHVAATHVPRSVPLPVPRPDFPVAPAVKVVEVRPLPAPSSELSSLEPHELRAPDKGAAASASRDQVTQPRGRLREGLATSAAPKGKAPHAGPEPGKTAALPPTVPYLVDSGSEPTAPLQHPRPAATPVAATHVPRSVPLPVPRPDFPVAPAVKVIEVRPLPAPSSELPSLEPNELRAPDKGVAASASRDQVTRPASNSATERPPAIQGVVGPAPALSGTEAPKIAREPAENTFSAPAEIKREPGEAGRELDDKQVAPRTAIAALGNPFPAGGESEVPSAGEAPNVAQPAPRSPPTDPERRSGDDPALTGEPHTGELASLPPFEPGAVLVNVGQIKTDARKTYVDVLVINTSERKLQDLDVWCDARDAQGLQVGQGSTTIRDVSPSDIAFGQALFPSEITRDNSKVSCVVEKFSDPHGSAP